MPGSDDADVALGEVRDEGAESGPEQGPGAVPEERAGEEPAAGAPASGYEPL
ncbi:hypothetical protein SAMN05216267_1013115 [Actinacidiphila rubida]|uniref:Uncharacterized protein n=1 Tax=Actinacidiphila rubida TaxID=310780 RepID=A0A1H8KND0_9ACTN|nr:hypothetical protein [Actinacidiphila rubida]SEN94470.1 hypothetical protein SAMN05216267_1013115 [Actinacidiphila rubida]